MPRSYISVRKWFRSNGSRVVFDASVTVLCGRTA